MAAINRRDFVGALVVGNKFNAVGKFAGRQNRRCGIQRFDAFTACEHGGGSDAVAAQNADLGVADFFQRFNQSQQLKVVQRADHRIDLRGLEPLRQCIKRGGFVIKRLSNRNRFVGFLEFSFRAASQAFAVELKAFFVDIGNCQFTPLSKSCPRSARLPDRGCATPRQHDAPADKQRTFAHKMRGKGFLSQKGIFFGIKSAFSPINTCTSSYQNVSVFKLPVVCLGTAALL